MPEPIDVKCPSCDQKLAAADESGLVKVLQEHLYEERAPEMPRERVRENVD
jgi:transcription initiation factor IIE alpha subunit